MMMFRCGETLGDEQDQNQGAAADSFSGSGSGSDSSGATGALAHIHRADRTGYSPHGLAFLGAVPTAGFSSVCPSSSSAIGRLHPPGSSEQPFPLVLIWPGRSDIKIISRFRDNGDKLLIAVIIIHQRGVPSGVRAGHNHAPVSSSSVGSASSHELPITMVAIPPQRR